MNKKDRPERLVSLILFRYLKDCATSYVGTKVDDGQVGKLVGLDASGTSHWKKGQKRFLNAVKLRRACTLVNADWNVVTGILDGNIPEKYNLEAELFTARAPHLKKR